MIEKLLKKRDELVLKHEFLSNQLKLQLQLTNKENAKKTKSSIRRLERNYDNLREEIYDYFLSLPDEAVDEVAFPNPEYITDLYGTVKTKTKPTKTNKPNKSDEKLLNEVAKEINGLFK